MATDIQMYARSYKRETETTTTLHIRTFTGLFINLISTLPVASTIKRAFKPYQSDWYSSHAVYNTLTHLVYTCTYMINVVNVYVLYVHRLEWV